MEPDELYTLRNQFWLGNFQQAINEGNSLTRLPAGPLQAEKKEYMYRSYLALGQYDVVDGEIQDDQGIPAELRAIKVLSAYLQGRREEAVAQVGSWVAAGESNPTVQVVSSLIYIHEGNIKEAMKCVSSGQTLEQRSMMVSLLLRMDRPDLAMKKYSEMRQIDEDSSLSVLASAWINMAGGGNKVNEACNLYEDLIDKFGGSPLLLNGLAAGKMHQGAYEEAETHLQEALTKQSSDADTLANLVVVCQQLRRPEDVIDRYIAQLKKAAPGHTLLQSLATFEQAFDRVANNLTV